MNPELWTSVDRYINDKLVASDAALETALQANAAANLPAIDVAPNQGKLLHLLARMQSAKRILEIGTLGGYSTIWLARAIPADGKVVTLEADPHHAAVAQQNIDRAGLSAVVELRLGPALASLQALVSERTPPFDFIFIDADKPNNPVYLEWCLRLARSGTVILADNVIRDGAILDPESQDASVQGTRALFDLLAAEDRLDATALQTVGMKGYDGFALAVVR